jgi:NADPH:quinone reductase-like Zn-dependent oxidoreductase
LKNEKKFDAIIDCTGEAKKCIPLLAKDGGICSILAGPTAEALQTWLKDAEWPTSKITIGVHSFLYSGCGGSLFQFFAGGTSLKSKCQQVGGSFHHTIGTGDGEIMQILSNLMKNNQLESIIDKEFTLKCAIEAIQYQKAGRCAGKVVVNIISEE